MPEFIKGFLVCLCFVSLVLLFADQDPQDNPEARVYCEMRKIFDDTGGEFGWPNYRDDIECINGEMK
jgi:hypothetical protein